MSLHRNIHALVRRLALGGCLALALSSGALAAVDPFADALQQLQSSAPLARRVAVDRLVQLGDARAVPALQGAAVSDADPGVRLAAIEALGRFKDPRAFLALDGLVKSSQTPFRHRQAAIRSLGELGVQSGASSILPLVGGPHTVEAVDALVKLKHPSSAAVIANYVTEVLRPQSNPVGFPPLRGDDEALVAAARALGALGGPAARAALLDLLAARQVRPPMPAGIQDPVLEETARSLVILGDPAGLKHMLGTLKDGTPWQRTQTAKTLGELKVREATGPLLRVLAENRASDLAAGVPQEVLRALGKIGDPATRPALLARLQDPSASVRAAAADGLGILGDRRSTPTLLSALEAEREQAQGDPQVVQAIVRALGDLRDPQATLPLTALLAATQTHATQAAIVDSLGRIGDARAVPALQDLARRNPSLAGDVVTALARISNPAPVPAAPDATGVSDAEAQALPDALGILQHLQRAKNDK